MKDKITELSAAYQSMNLHINIEFLIPQIERYN